MFGKKGKATRFEWRDKTTRPQSNRQHKKKTFLKRGGQKQRGGGRSSSSFSVFFSFYLTFSQQPMKIEKRLNLNAYLS